MFALKPNGSTGWMAQGGACRDRGARTRFAGTSQSDGTFLEKAEATRVDSDAAARCGLRSLHPMVARVGAAPRTDDYRHPRTAPGAFRRFLSRMTLSGRGFTCPGFVRERPGRWFGSGSRPARGLPSRNRPYPNRPKGPKSPSSREGELETGSRLHRVGAPCSKATKKRSRLGVRTAPAKWVTGAD